MEDDNEQELCDKLGEVSFFNNFVGEIKNDFEKNVSPLKKPKLMTTQQKKKKNEADEVGGQINRFSPLNNNINAEDSETAPINFTEKMMRNLIAVEPVHIPPFSTRRIRTDW